MANKKLEKKITPSDVHKEAEAAGIVWDDNPDFEALSKRITGKAHIDDMTSGERTNLKNEISRLRKSKPRFKERVESFITKVSEKNPLLDKLYYSSEESFDDAVGSGDVFYMKDEGSNQHIPIKMEGLKSLWEQSGRPDIGVGEDRASYSPAAGGGFLKSIFGRDYISTSDPFGIGAADKNDMISELSHGLRYQDPKEYGYKSRRDMRKTSKRMRENAQIGSDADRELYETEGNEEYYTHSITDPIVRKWLKDNYSYSEKSEKEIPENIEEKFINSVKE